METAAATTTPTKETGALPAKVAPIIKQIEGFQTETLAFLSELKKVEVKKAEDVELATGSIGQVNRGLKRLDTSRQMWVKPFNSIVKDINARIKQLTEPLTGEKKRITQAIAAFRQAEVQRIEAENRKIAEEEAKAREEQIEKAKNGIGAAAEELVTLKREKPQEKLSATTDSYERKSWKWEVVEEEKVPREYLCVDIRKVNLALASAEDKENLVIPGIRIWNEPIIIPKKAS